MSKDIGPTKTMAAVASFFIALLLAVSTVSADWGDRRQLRRELDLFHSFLQKHPKASAQLQANPRLAYSRRFLDKHDDLKKFFKKYPAVQREVAENPERVFGRYDRDDHRYSRDDQRWGWGWGYR
jgi:hypothetical protein